MDILLKKTLIQVVFFALLLCFCVIKIHAAENGGDSAAVKNIQEIIRDSPDLLRSATLKDAELQQLRAIVTNADAALAEQSEETRRLWIVDQKVKALLALYRNKLPESYEQLKELQRSIDILAESGEKNYAGSAKAARFFQYRFELQYLGRGKGGEDLGPNPFRLKESIKRFAKTLPQREADALLSHLVEVSKQRAMSDTKFAVETLNEIGEMFLESSNRNTVDDGRKLIATARRYELLGQPLVFTGKTLDGKTFSSDDLKGKVVLIEYWASWCAPCTKMLPQLRYSYGLYKDRGFEIIAVNADKDEVARDKYIKKERLPWVITEDTETLASGGDRLSRHYGIHAYPSMILMDRKGNVVATDFDVSTLNKELARLFQNSQNTQSTAGKDPPAKETRPSSPLLPKSEPPPDIFGGLGSDPPNLDFEIGPPIPVL